jgi:hypothetical protein
MENAVPVAGVAGGASSRKSTVCKIIIDQLRDQRVVVVTQVGTMQLWLHFPPRLVERASSYNHSSLALLSLLLDAKNITPVDARFITRVLHKSIIRLSF